MYVTSSFLRLGPETTRPPLFDISCCRPIYVLLVSSFRVTPPPTNANFVRSDYTPSRSRAPAPESRAIGGGGSIRLHAQRIFTVSDEDVEEMLKAKVKGASKVKRSYSVAPGG